MIALLDLHGHTWLARGLHRSVHAWLRELADPRLDLWRALALLPVEPEGARPLFGAARKASAAAGHAAHAYEAWCGEVSSFVVQWGAVHGLADLVDELETLEATLGPPPGGLAFRTSADAAIVDWQCGKPEDCYEKVKRGLALADASGVHVRDFFLLTQGIFCALSQEDWPRAQEYLLQLARTERTHKRLDTMIHHFFRSWYSHCRGDPRTALAHAETAWPIADAIGSMFHKVIVLSALAPARVHCGDLEGAEEAYRAQLALAKNSLNPTFSFIAFCSGAETTATMITKLHLGTSDTFDFRASTSTDGTTWSAVTLLPRDGDAVSSALSRTGITTNGTRVILFASASQGTSGAKFGAPKIFTSGTPWTVSGADGEGTTQPTGYYPTGRLTKAGKYMLTFLGSVPHNDPESGVTFWFQP